MQTCEHTMLTYQFIFKTVFLKKIKLEYTHLFEMVKHRSNSLSVKTPQYFHFLCANCLVSHQQLRTNDIRMILVRIYIDIHKYI